MSIFANLSGTTADFYLAQIDPIHAGKTMRINLFDSGEGANSCRSSIPTATRRAFSWTTPCNPPTPPTGTCSGTGDRRPSERSTCPGAATQPYTGLHSTSKYNDRFITIDIPLPPNYTTVSRRRTVRGGRSGTNAGSAPTDRTTWSVNIVGDPVHLLQ